MIRKLYHGAAFYPELWSEDTIRQDIAMMREAGINVVRMGEFAWSTIEPEEGAIDLSFFAELIGRLHASGIDTIMCTPTATPPIWYSHGHPERLFVDERGTVLGHGSRQHACTNHPYFREKAAIIAERLARELGSLPGVIGWQLDNEFKAHVAECMCQACRTLWHEWLERRYGTVRRLNELWGTHVWSVYYGSFDQVPQPGPTPFLHHSSLRTMYRLFSMEKIAEFADEQAAVIRRHSDAPVTHNGSIAFHVDNERLFRNLDFASYDTYASAANYGAYLINCDLWRNAKRGRPFWIMETSPSHAGSLESAGTPHPDGYLQAEAFAAYALGAEGFCYWPWRQQRSGSEQPHGSVVSAWGAPAVGYRNVLGVERLRKAIEPLIAGSKPSRAEVAIAYSDRAKAFLQTEPHRGMKHRGLVTGLYERVLAAGIHRDLLPEGAELDGYKVVWTPFLPYLPPDYIERALAFAEQGGIWIAGPMTGIRTEEHTLPADAALGALERLAGVETSFAYPMDGTSAIGEAFGLEAPLSLWSAAFEPKEAEAVGLIRGGVSPGLAFLTERRIGRGKLVLLGSLPAGEAGNAMLEKLIVHYADEAGVILRTDSDAGTVVAPRESEAGRLWFIVNMNGEGGSVTLPEEGVDKMNGERVGPGKLTVGRFECRVVAFPAAHSS